MAEKDVFDDSSTSEFEDDTDSSAGKPDGTKSKNDGRSLDNVRGEFSRKHDELKAQVAGLTDAVQKMANALTARMQTPDARPTPTQPPVQRPIVSPYGAPNPDINEYTDEQLQQALASGRLDPYQTRVIEGILSERRIERKTQELFEQRDRKQVVSRAQAEAHEAALAAFPALRDSNSEFAQRVAGALKAQRDTFGPFPTDEFDVARRVADSMGLQASRITIPGYIGKPEGGDKEDAVEDDVGMSDDEIAEIAHNLRYAMPLRRNPETGKMERKKFNLKRIKERSKRYQENSNLYQGGRKIKGSSR